MRSQLKNTKSTIAVLLLMGVVLSIIITFGETLPQTNRTIKGIFNLIKNLTNYVYAPFFIGIMLLLFPKVWEINEKLDDE